jgi:hypothetical protein
MSNLFDQIDPSGSGSITQSQFGQAFQSMSPPASFQKAGADAVWGKLDPTGSGSVSKQAFVTEMTAMMKELRGHHSPVGSTAGAQALAQTTSLLDALGNPATGSAPPASSGAGSIINALA